ncbi:MBL fold metallo-hydrolase [Paenibacillus sp. NFR01]|uniref:MBL fold metallo-hydrolase n=1 Tax=Paenibacillus sp. NFR01 TaxID=1566279 RepID=UPI0008D1D9A3|nr:MBL fold metallo-hydrolase [Paenibacillus sp. NFR01]SET93996.1 Glyoxylase, beta-lactamase superfamily II [Paenibacillus sp. NFR01]
MNDWGAQVIMLTIPMNNDEIHPILLKDDDGYTLIDTGVPGGSEALIAAIEGAGARLEDIKRILITHQDLDHIGNLPVLKRRLPEAEILAHPGDIPAITGSKPMIKMTEARLAAMPEAIRQNTQRFLEQLKTLGDITELNDGDRLPYGGGIQIIHTPGHTPGHISLYVPDQELLLAADELRIIGGELEGPAPEFTPDLPLALASLRKFAGLKVRSIICYHGGVYEGSPQRLIDKLS